MPEQTFAMIPANSTSYYFVIPVALVMLLGFVLLSWTVYGSTHTTFHVSGGTLRIKGPIYGRSISAEKLRWSDARKVDLNQNSGLKLRFKLNGSGLPGFSSGWYRLIDGTKALVFVTDLSKVVAIPTTEGYTVLLSVADPDGFLAAARVVPQAMPR